MSKHRELHYDIAWPCWQLYLSNTSYEPRDLGFRGWGVLWGGFVQIADPNPKGFRGLGLRV